MYRALPRNCSRLLLNTRLSNHVKPAYQLSNHGSEISVRCLHAVPQKIKPVTEKTDQENQDAPFKTPSLSDLATSETTANFEQLCTAAKVEPKIGFIGGGNMAQAMVKGFLNSGLITIDKICVSDPKPSESLKNLDVNIESENNSLLSTFGHGITVLAVKPDALPSVLTYSKETLKRCSLLITVLAGTPIQKIQSQLDPLPVPIVRVMPNTAALVGSAASVFARGQYVTEGQAQLVTTLMNTIGTCHEVAEGQLDAVTGLSGSGPAYVFTVIDSLADGGVKMGLPRDLATHLAAQTVLGAAKMVLETGQHPGQLKNAVCSPGGTTITGVHVLEERGLRGAMISAVEAAVKRSQELGAMAVARK